MTHPAHMRRLTVADYLAAEDGADLRHEYIDCELYVMTGASRCHGLIVGNLYAWLRPQLRGGPCQLFANDMKVRLRIAEQDVFYYPDLLLTCDPSDRETYPSLPRRGPDGEGDGSGHGRLIGLATDVARPRGPTKVGVPRRVRGV